MSKPIFLTSSALCTLAITAAGEPVEWVKLFPYGEIKPGDGRKPWTIRDKAHGEEIVAASLKATGSRQEMPIDYDHQSDFGAVPGVGGRAPAAGWMKALEARDDGIYARVEWTAAGQEALRAGEYRYLSPTFFDDKGRNVRLIVRAALTNNPALDLPAVAASHNVDNKESDDMKEIALALGLPETASMEEIQAAIAALNTASKAANDALAAVRTAAGAKDDADGAALATVITAMRSTGDTAELQRTVITLQTDLNALRAERTDESATAAVDAAIKAGKVIPAARETFLNLAKSDRAAFDAIVGITPVIVAPGGGQRGHVDPETVTLTAEDRAIAASMEISEDAFLAAKKKGQA